MIFIIIVKKKYEKRKDEKQPCAAFSGCGAIVWVNLPQLVKVGVERGRAQQDVGCNLHATRHYFFKFFKYLGLGGCVGVTGPVTRWRLGMGRGTHAMVLGLDQNAGSVAFCTYILRWSHLRVPLNQ